MKGFCVKVLPVCWPRLWIHFGRMEHDWFRVVPYNYMPLPSVALSLNAAHSDILMM